MFAGNAGLASDAQACLEFGTWDYVGFERDPFIWQQACSVVSGHMSTLDRKEKEIKGKLKANLKILPIMKKIRESGLKSLDEDEVRFSSSEFYVVGVFRKNFMRKRVVYKHHAMNMQ